MEEGSMKLKLIFNADDVSAALDAASKEGLLCGTCTNKIETQDEMSQSDFCPACQAAVNSQLGSIVERHMKETLVRMGLPPDAFEVTKD